MMTKGHGGRLAQRIGWFAALAGLCLAAVVNLSAQSNETHEVNHGFFYDKHPLTLASGWEWEAAGPFYLRQEWESTKVLALPPFFSRQQDVDPDIDSLEWDFLYPVVSHDRYGSEWRWHFFQIFSFAGGRTGEDEEKQRFTLFPFYFRQSSTNPTNDYWAVMPFYGHLKARLFRDEVNWVMFPAYVQTRKRDVVTDNYLLPFVHVRKGLSLKGWQVWPIMGHERREPHNRTNSFDELVLAPGHDKWFFLWPFFHDQHTGVGTDNPSHMQALIPLYGFQRSPMRDSTSVLWPFGFSYTDDRERKYREYSAPWPFITFARGEGKTLDRVFPLYSSGHTATLQSESVLWPLRTYKRVQSAPLDRERLRIMYFLYSDTVERNTETKEYRRFTGLWPLFTHRKDRDGNERLQMFAVLEPFLPQNKAIQRNHSQLWSIWKSETNKVTQAGSQSFLWNLYRQEATPEQKKTSLFFGLIKIKTKPKAKDVPIAASANAHDAGGTLGLTNTALSTRP